MTTQEMMWVAKHTAKDIHLKLKYDDFECQMVTDKDILSDFPFISKNNYANPFSDIRVRYNKQGKVQYSICVRSLENKFTVYECDISQVELLEREDFDRISKIKESKQTV